MRSLILTVGLCGNVSQFPFSPFLKELNASPVGGEQGLVFVLLCLFRVLCCKKAIGIIEKHPVVVLIVLQHCSCPAPI